MDHQSLVASLPPEQRKQLTATSDAAGLLHLALHLGAIAVCGTLITARRSRLVGVGAGARRAAGFSCSRLSMKQCT
jgi:hypothetical protein